MLIIQDKKLCRDLEEIAAITHQSVEELIGDLILDQVAYMPLGKIPITEKELNALHFRTKCNDCRFLMTNENVTFCELEVPFGGRAEVLLTGFFIKTEDLIVECEGYKKQENKKVEKEAIL